MSERVQVAAKKPEAKRENRASQVQKTGPSQSISSPVEQILFLQRTIGNQAIGRLIKSGALQAKLRIGQPHDIYEQEADRMAEQVMHMPESPVSKGTAISKLNAITPIRRKCPGCTKVSQSKKEEEEESLLKKEAHSSTPEVKTELESNINAIRGGGMPLPESTRTFYEKRLGNDFSDVKVHTDSRAAEAVRAVNARAFTIGQDIFFGSGRYQPQTQQGRKLLAHELSHTIQQKAGKSSAVRNSLQPMPAFNDSEVEIETESIDETSPGITEEQHVEEISSEGEFLPDKGTETPAEIGQSATISEEPLIKGETENVAAEKHPEKKEKGSFIPSQEAKENADTLINEGLINESKKETPESKSLDTHNERNSKHVLTTSAADAREISQQKESRLEKGQEPSNLISSGELERGSEVGKIPKGTGLPSTEVAQGPLDESTAETNETKQEKNPLSPFIIEKSQRLELEAEESAKSILEGKEVEGSFTPIPQSIQFNLLSRKDGIIDRGIEWVTSNIIEPIRRLASAGSEAMKGIGTRISYAYGEAKKEGWGFFNHWQWLFHSLRDVRRKLFAEKIAEEKNQKTRAASEKEVAPGTTPEEGPSRLERIDSAARAVEDFTEKGFEIQNEIMEGAILGDFKENPTIWNTIGQIAMGFVPYAGQVADIRDLIASIKKLHQSGWKDGWEWFNLVLVIIGFIPGIGDLIKAGGRGLKGVIRRAGGWILKHGGNLWRKIAGKIPGILRNARKFGRKIVNGAVDMARKLGQGVRELGRRAINAAKSAIQKARGLVTRVTDSVRGLAARVAERARSAVNSARGLLGRVAGAISRAASRAFEAARSLISKGSDIIKSIMGRGKEILKKIGSKVADVGRRAGDFLKESVRKAVETGRRALKTAKDAASRAFNRAVQTGKQLATRGYNSVRNLYNNGKKWVKDKAFKWIKDKLGGIKERILKFLKEKWERLKEKLGIKEPQTGKRGCFVAGTKVVTDTSIKPIEKLNIGEMVLSFDPILGKRAHQQITQIFVRTSSVVLDIQIDQTRITCTPDHPFWIPGRSWQKAGTIEPGELLLTKVGQIAKVSSIQVREGSFTVFNIEVEGLNTYYVSDIGILVHNKAMMVTTTPKGRILTEHAEESLRRHGFQEPWNRIDDIIENYTRTVTQADGAKVYIKRLSGRGRTYDLVIEGGEGGIVTGMRNKTAHELNNLARNYGWEPWP